MPTSAKEREANAAQKALELIIAEEAEKQKELKAQKRAEKKAKQKRTKQAAKVEADREKRALKAAAPKLSPAPESVTVRKRKENQCSLSVAMGKAADGKAHVLSQVQITVDGVPRKKAKGSPPACTR